MPVKVRPYKQGRFPGVWEIHIRGYFPDKALYEEKVRSELTKSGALRWGQQREIHILSLGLDGWKEEKGAATHPPQTLAEFAPAWLDDRVKLHRQSLSTKLHRQSLIKNHLVPLFGEKLLGDITELDFQRLKKSMSEASSHHVNGVIVTLRLILKAAHKTGQRKEAPPDVPYLPKPKTESLWYEPEDYERLIAKTIDPMMKAAILLGGDAGLRMGEILGLEWSALHFARNQLEVKKAISRNEEKAPKWNSFRSIEMTARLVEALKAVQEGAARVGRVLRPVGLLALRTDDVPTTKKLAYALRLAEQSAGLVPRGRLHMLRHAFGARLAMAGATIKEIAELMGHKNLKTTEIYMHLSPSLKGRAIKLLERGEVGDRMETEKSSADKELKLL